jgi:hypothetical protein
MKPLHFFSVMIFLACFAAAATASFVLAFILRKKFLMTVQASSIGLSVGEYGGKNRTLIPTSLRVFSTF